MEGLKRPRAETKSAKEKLQPLSSLIEQTDSSRIKNIKKAKNKKIQKNSVKMSAEVG